jgi:hypothetical protein
MLHSPWCQGTCLVVIIALGWTCSTDLANEPDTYTPREAFDISSAARSAVQATREAAVVVRATMEPTVGLRVTSTGSSPRPGSTPPVTVSRPWREDLARGLSCLFAATSDRTLRYEMVCEKREPAHEQIITTRQYVTHSHSLNGLLAIQV